MSLYILQQLQIEAKAMQIKVNFSIRAVHYIYIPGKNDKWSDVWNDRNENKDI